MKKLLKTGFYLIIIGIFAFNIRFFQHKLDHVKEIHFIDRRPVFVPNGNILKWMSLGYRGVVSDWLWIKTVIYTGRRVKEEDNPYYLYVLEQGSLQEELHEHKPIEKPAERPEGLAGLSSDLWHLLYQRGSLGLIDYIYPMLDRVTTLDPYFIHPYIFGGIYILMHTGEIERAKNLLEKGYRANPDLWMFPFYLGWVHWMYLGDLETTHKYLLEAVSKEDCPVYVYNMLQAISGEIGQNELAIKYLSGLYHSTDSPKIKKKIENILLKIRKIQKP